MAISTSKVSMSDIASELKKNPPISIKDSDVINLAQASGKISFSQLAGKSSKYVGILTATSSSSPTINPTHFKGFRIYNFWTRSNPMGYILNFGVEGNLPQNEIKNIKIYIDSNNSLVIDTNNKSMTPEYTFNGTYATWKFGYFNHNLQSGTRYRVEIE